MVGILAATFVCVALFLFLFGALRFRLMDYSSTKNPHSDYNELYELYSDAVSEKPILEKIKLYIEFHIYSLKYVYNFNKYTNEQIIDKVANFIPKNQNNRAPGSRAGWVPLNEQRMKLKL